MYVPAPQVPLSAVTSGKKACEDNCLSYLPWKLFSLIFRTNKPIRMEFLSIFLQGFRGPRKMVIRLKIMHSKRAGNHGTLQAKSTSFHALIFIPKSEKLLLCDLKWKGKTKINEIFWFLVFKLVSTWLCVFHFYFLVFAQILSIIVKEWKFRCICFVFSSEVNN